MNTSTRLQALVRLRPTRGVSLIEALVAMAVMAFGMLALVGVQATMRLNADVARQRGEATRIATEEIERWRGFVRVAADAGDADRSWDEIVSRTVNGVVVPIGTGNTSFVMESVVTPIAGSAQKAVSVTVSWKDRINGDQSVVLTGVLTRAVPALSGLLSVPATLAAPSQRSGRHPTIPVRAHDIDSTRSGFKPAEGGTVVWVFDNLTGVITSVCTVAAGVTSAGLTVDNIANCQAITAQLLAGQIRFNLRGSTQDLGDGTSVVKPVPGGTIAYVLDNNQLQVVRRCTVAAASTTQTLVAADVVGAGCVAVVQPVSPFDAAVDAAYVLVASDAVNPIWPALNLQIDLVGAAPQSVNLSTQQCFTDAPSSAALANVQTSVDYFCIIVAVDASGWGGRFGLQPLAFSDGGAATWTLGTGAGQYKACRYTQANSDVTVNANHPAYYCQTSSAVCTDKVTGNLVRQNFLVIDGGKACPSDVAVDPGAGDLVNTNTRQHQPAP
jgi:hypothetical protein